MRVVLFGPAYPFRGGIAQTTDCLYAALREAGHEVRVVGFKKQFPKLLFPGKTQFDDSPQTPKTPSERVFTLWNPLTWFRTARAIAKLDPDLIVFMWWMPFFGAGYWGVAKLLPRRCRKRIVYLMHNVMPHERRIGDVFLSRLALNSARSYVALSQAEEREMHRLFPEVDPRRIRCSPLPAFSGYAPFTGSREAAQKKIGVEAGKLLLFFGFVREYKGLDILLRAMPEILRRDPQIQLVVAGEFYQDRARYDELIASLAIGHAVIIHDRFLAGDEVGAYFAAADCLILPYRSATQSAIVPISFMLDMPVVTTQVGALAEVVRNGVSGFVVPPEDPPALADAVRAFYDAGGKAAFLDNVRREAGRFSWKALADVITGLGKS